MKGTIFLTVATLLSKVLGSVFRIPLQNIAGDEVHGIFTLVYPVYMVALIISVAGIPIAISKLIAEVRVHQDTVAVRHIFITASFLAFAFGLSGFLVLQLLLDPLASLLGEGTRGALFVVSLTLLVAPYMAVYRGFFQGFDDMRPTALSQVFEQFIRVGVMLAIAIYLVFQGKGAETTATWMMYGSVVGALFALLYLRWRFDRSVEKPTKQEAYSFQAFKTWSKRILQLSGPILVGALAMALMNLVDSGTVPYALKKYGLSETAIYNQAGVVLGRGLSLIQIATVLATSLVLQLIPLISKAIEKGDKDEARTIVERTHRWTQLLAWPVAIGMASLVYPINLAAFTDVQESKVLAVYFFSSVFMSVTILGTGILQGINRARAAAWIIIGAALLKVVLNITLIASFGLIGVAVSTVIIYVLALIMNTWLINRKVPFHFLTKDLGVYVVSSIVMGAMISAPLLMLDVLAWSRLQAVVYVILATAVGAAVYFLLVWRMNGISRDEVKQLRGGA